MTTAAQTANVFGNDNIVVLAEGSGVDVKVEVLGARPHLRLTRYAKLTERAAKTGSDVSLLSAFRRDVVPLIGRNAEKASLRAWLDSQADLSLRVLVGGAGRGKTRLAAEFCDEVSKTWLAGFIGAGEFDRFRRDGHTEQWRWDKPVLVVVDYPASRVAALKDWLRELVDAPLEGRPKLRILLLERQAQREIGWLSELVGRGQDANSEARIALLDPDKPVELPPLEGLEYRREVFAAMLARAGLEAPAVGQDADFDRRLGEHKWGGDPLFLMMAGLVAADAGVKAALSLSRTELADKLALAELDRIGRLGAARGIDPAADPKGRFLRRMAVLATLVQGASLEAARGLAAAEARALGVKLDLDGVVTALREALPGAGLNVGAILPDIVGEAALLAVFDQGGEGVAGGLTAEPFLAAAAAKELRAASATLVRAAQDFSPAGRLTPVRWLDALVAAQEKDLGALMEIANALPNETVALRETGVALYEKILKQIEAIDDERFRAPYLGYALNNLAGRYHDLARNEAALEAAQQAVAIYRRLAANPAFLSLLAGSIGNLSIALKSNGRWDDSLEAAREGVDIWRKLTADQKDEFARGLAEALNNLGVRLRELGRRREALDVSQECVQVCRRLNVQSHGKFGDTLAAALLGYSNCLGDVGRLKDALGAAKEAAAIVTRLAAENADSFLPSLGLQLSNLVVRLSAVGQNAQALASAEEAVEIYRRLAADRPNVFLPHFAGSLNNLGMRFGDLGRNADALNAIGKAINIQRRLAEERPEAFLADLAMSCNNLISYLQALGRHDEALKSAEEAVEIRRRLVKERPDAFVPTLAGSLANRANCFEALGRREEALASIREALATLAPAFLGLPRAHARWMAMMVEDYSKRCKRLSREPDAALLAPIVETLQSLQPSDDPSLGPRPRNPPPEPSARPAIDAAPPRNVR